MSATLTRLILCFGVLVAVVVLYIVVLIAVDEPGRGEWELLVAGITSCIALAGAWTLIWRGQVRWPTWRRWNTAAVAGGACIPAVAVYGITAAMVRRGDEIGILLGAMAWAAAWLIGSALVWRETAAERGQRLRSLGVAAVACPACGYNMTGLKSTQCPECGAAYTVDQLLAELIEQRDQPIA